MKFRINPIFALTCIALLAICRASNAYSETLTERIKNGEPIRQAVSNDSPFGYVGKDGKITGIEVALAAQVIQEMGGKIEPVVTTFGAMIPGIQAGRFDIASGGIYIRPERCRVATFSTPDLMIGVGAFVSASNSTVHVSSLNELAASKALKFGKLTGGMESKAFAVAGGDITQISDFTDRGALTAAVSSGRIDVGLLSSMGAASAVANDHGLKLLTPLSPPMVDGKPYVYYAGFAFPKGDDAFVTSFNQHLKAIVQSPAYAVLLAKYGVPKDVIPTAAADTAQACAASQ